MNECFFRATTHNNKLFTSCLLPRVCTWLLLDVRMFLHVIKYTLQKLRSGETILLIGCWFQLAIDFVQFSDKKQKHFGHHNIVSIQKSYPCPYPYSYYSCSKKSCGWMLKSNTHNNLMHEAEPENVTISGLTMTLKKKNKKFCCSKNQFPLVWNSNHLLVAVLDKINDKAVKGRIRHMPGTNLFWQTAASSIICHQMPW